MSNHAFIYRFKFLKELTVTIQNLTLCLWTCHSCMTSSLGLFTFFALASTAPLVLYIYIIIIDKLNQLDKYKLLNVDCWHITIFPSGWRHPWRFHRMVTCHKSQNKIRRCRRWLAVDFFFLRTCPSSFRPDSPHFLIWNLHLGEQKNQRNRPSWLLGNYSPNLIKSHFSWISMNHLYAYNYLLFGTLEKLKKTSFPISSL